MIKIIKPGHLKEAQCLKCGAVLSYDENEDVQKESSKIFLINCIEAYSVNEEFIICPQCKNKIVLKTVR